MRIYSIIAAIAATTSLVHAYSTKAYDLAYNMAEFASIGYCIKGVGTYDNLIESPTLKTGDFPVACPTMTFCTENKDVDVVTIMNPEGFELSGSGYVAVDHTNERIIVVLRGSYTIQDWLTDFDFGLVPYPRCALCAVHHGVYEATKNIKEQSWGTIEGLIDQYPDYELMTTGHSLGGGLTVLVGLEMALDFEKRVTIVSLAGLKIGNNHFSDFVDKTFNTDEYLSKVQNETATEAPYGGHLRITHEADIVPLIPPTALYAHSGVEIYINKVRLPHPQSVTELIGKYSYLPIASQLLNILEQRTLQELLTIYEHLNYFIPLYGCNSSTSLLDLIPGPNDDGNITQVVLDATTPASLTYQSTMQTSLVNSN